MHIRLLIVCAEWNLLWESYRNLRKLFQFYKTPIRFL